MDFREKAQRQLAPSRSFGNRRQLAAYAGLASTPWRSGTVDQEQGISKAGNPRLRRTM
jgi:transposase